MLSLLMWLLYLYFIREALIDLYSLAEDSFQWAFAAAEKPELPTISRFLETMENYGIVVLANGAVLIAWALYNQIRFRGRDRHRIGETVNPTDLSELYGIPVEDIVTWQESRILVMQHDAAGTLIGVTPKDPGKLQPTGEQGPPVAAAWKEQIA